MRRIKDFETPFPIPFAEQHIRYNAIQRADDIYEYNKSIEYNYGADGERYKSTYSTYTGVNTSPEVYSASKTKTKEKIYLGSYEIEKDATGSVTNKTHYIQSPSGLCAIIQNNQVYATYTDHIGSIAVITDVNGNVVERNSYDAWGRRRINADWTTYETANTTHLVDRGYTMHEHLSDFGIINMNARLYDPIIGRMFSPDMMLSDPSYSQDYNKYTYARNNPIRYTDPTGNIVLNTFEVVAYHSFSNHGSGQYKMSLLEEYNAGAADGHYYNSNYIEPRNENYIANANRSNQINSFLSIGRSRIDQGSKVNLKVNENDIASLNRVYQSFVIIPPRELNLDVSFNTEVNMLQYAIPTIDNSIIGVYNLAEEISEAQGGGGTTGVLTFPSLANHYISGGVNNYYLTKGTFNSLINELSSANRINYNTMISSPGVKGLYQIDVDTRGTSYANSVGYATLYLNRSGFVGYSDWWNFEKHNNGDRGPWGEFKTTIGSLMPGNPFWVLYGTTPPLNLIPRH